MVALVSFAGVHAVDSYLHLREGVCVGIGSGAEALCEEVGAAAAGYGLSRVAYQGGLGLRLRRGAQHAGNEQQQEGESGARAPRGGGRAAAGEGGCARAPGPGRRGRPGGPSRRSGGEGGSPARPARARRFGSRAGFRLGPQAGSRVGGRVRSGVGFHVSVSGARVRRAAGPRAGGLPGAGSPPAGSPPLGGAAFVPRRQPRRRVVRRVCAPGVRTGCAHRVWLVATRRRAGAGAGLPPEPFRRKPRKEDPMSGPANSHGRTPSR